jgi:hypothetical protein
VNGETFICIELHLPFLLDGTHSSTCDVDSGAPQGTVLGPLLFLIFVNDLLEYVTSNARLFADDCLLYRVINNNKDQHQLQNNLQLEIWEKKWQMQFNADKCFTIHLTKKRKTAWGAPESTSQVEECVPSSSTC